jgi:hypothetical protein
VWAYFLVKLHTSLGQKFLVAIQICPSVSTGADDEVTQVLTIYDMVDIPGPGITRLFPPFGVLLQRRRKLVTMARFDFYKVYPGKIIRLGEKALTNKA